MKSHQKTLDKVHSAKNNEELVAAYDEWAEHYDKDLIEGFDYKAPAAAVELLAGYVDDEDARILDAGCGTGLVGQCLRGKGFRNVDAMDYSRKMLDKAEAKNLYRKLIRADMNKPLDKADLPDGSYDAVICVGTFSHGHVGPQALSELARITRKGGLVCLTVRSSAYESDNYRAAMLDLESKDLWELLYLREQDYLPTDGIDCKLCLYRVTAP